MDFCEFNITVVGLGLIGGSYAMALRELRPRKLWGLDWDTEVIEKAALKGIIDRSCKSTEEILEQSDLVIIALYPEDTIQFTRKYKDYFKSGAIITDTAGIKGRVVREIQGFLRSDVDFIGGHPMAGKAENGFSNADKIIFCDSNYIITPTEQNKPENLNFIAQMASRIGCRNIISLTPEEHDEAIALTSQLPHIIAVSLVNSAENYDKIPGLIGGSFKDATRVAVLNSKLWCELLKSNSTNIIHIIEIFEESIKNMKTAIAESNETYLEESFGSAFRRRKGIG